MSYNLIHCGNKILNTLRYAITGIFCLLCLGLSTHTFADIQTESALTPSALLQTAIQDGQLDEVRTLIEAGVDVNQPLADGTPPLHAAVIHHHENIIAVLLQAGANVNSTDPTTHATPLHLAALYGRQEIAALLIQKGANINAPMQFGITPLLVAAQFNQAQIVQLLLDKKVPVNQADQEGFTALHFAAQNGDEIIVQLLLDHGAKINMADKATHRTPLTVAIENQHPTVVHLLKERGGM